MLQLYETEPDFCYWPWITDREAELWGPLVIHARLAGSETEADLLEVVKRFSEAKAEIKSAEPKIALTVEILGAISANPGTTFMPADLLNQLLQMEEWGRVLAQAKGRMRCCISIEHIDWSRQVIFDPHGKTRASRRHVPISKRMFNILMVRCGEKRIGWLFPSKRAAGGHLTTVAKQFSEARREAGLPEDLALCCARHTFGTAVYEATGNLAMVMKVMGHADARTAMHYQHCVGSHSRGDRPAEFTSQFTSQ